MRVIEQFYQVPQAKSWQEDPLLFIKIQTMFMSQCIPFQIAATTPKELKSIVELKFKMPSDKILTSFWTFTVTDHLELKIELADLNNQVSQESPPTKIGDYIKMLNSSTQGVYFIDKNNPKTIGFRFKFPFETSKQYLNSYIRQIYMEISHQFRRFAVFAKLYPGNEEQPCKKISDTLLRLRLLKEEFEFARQQRKRSTNCYNLSNSSIKLVSQALNIINLCFGKFKAYSWQSKIDLGRCHKLYTTLKIAVQENAVKEQERINRFIVKGIEIQDIYEEKEIDEGGFSKIHKGIYQFHELLTFNSNSINHTQRLPLDENDLKEGLHAPLSKLLVRKLPKDEKDISHQNQFELLKHLRNQKNGYIADYYLSNSPKVQYNDGIYIQYYQANLAKAYQTWKETELLKVSKQILQGIYFLWQNKILHRDLKELNVLIDQSGNAKLIDFGSSSGFFTNQNGQFRAVSNRLMATKGYFFPYNDIRMPSITSKYQREQFNQAQTFDMYSFGQILNNIFSLENIQDNLISRQLTYFAKKCQEMNPEDRIYPLQAMCYFKEIVNLFVQENSIQAEDEEVKNDALNPANSKKSTKSTTQQ